MNSSAVDELTKPRTVDFWGQKYHVTPVLVEKVLGDGKQIIGFSPLNTRPDYYIVRVDSKWCLDNWNRDADDQFIDHVNDVYEAIEEEYGNVRICQPECDDGDCWDKGDECPHGRMEWPVLDDDAGSEWWLIQEPPKGFSTQESAWRDAAHSGLVRKPKKN